MRFRVFSWIAFGKLKGAQEKLLGHYTRHRLTLSFHVGYRSCFAFLTAILTVRPVRLVA